MFVVIGGCSCLLLPLWHVPWTLAMFTNTATTIIGSPCLIMAHLPIFPNTLQEGKKGGSWPRPWLMFVVIGGCSCLLLPLWHVPWSLAMFTNTATTMIGSPCLIMAHFSILDNTLQEGKKGGSWPRPWLMFVVIGGCSCLLLPLWHVPWTLAMFTNTATTMIGSPCPCLIMAHLPIFPNT